MKKECRLTGYTKSSDGDITGQKGGGDIWVVKLDNSGDVVWTKTYGGTSDDFSNGIHQTFDGNFIICGYSSSNNGDLSINYGGYDTWMHVNAQPEHYIKAVCLCKLLERKTNAQTNVS